MADSAGKRAPTRRLAPTPRRADARRSVDAVLSAARTVLGDRPDASMEEIATAAGVSRQTVYAHFPSRDALIAALISAAGRETVEAIDAAHLDAVSPPEALRRFINICWELIRRNPFLLASALNQDPPGASDSHRAGTARLQQLICRGQRAGDFASAMPAAWLADAIVGLARTAAEQVAADRLTANEAVGLLLDSSLRLCGTEDAS